MKYYKHLNKILLFTGLMFCLIACSTKINKLEFKLEKANEGATIENLKQHLILLEGISMVTIHPDGEIVYISYDRLKTSEKSIETQIEASGYHFQLINKERVTENGDN